MTLQHACGFASPNPDPNPSPCPALFLTGSSAISASTPALPARARVWRLGHSWPWAAWVTLLAVAAMIALVAVVYSLEIGPAGRFRRIVLAALRLSAIGLVLLMIAQWVLELNPTQLPYLVVMVDDSESMKIADHYDKESLAPTSPGGSKRPASTA